VKYLIKKTGSGSHFLTLALFIFLGAAVLIGFMQSVTEAGVSNQMLSIIVGLVVIILGWLYALGRSAHARIDKHKDMLAEARLDIVKELGEHARRAEVENLVNKTVAPIREDVKEMKGDVKWLVRNAKGIPEG